MLKLRTICVDAEARKTELAELNECDGPIFKVRKDPRITRVGRVLRKLSIDELPQLWNVLRGDMSLAMTRQTFFQYTVLERDLGDDFLQLPVLASQVFDLVLVASRTVSPASCFLPASRKSLLQRL